MKNLKNIELVCKKLQKDGLEPTTELEYTNNFTLLVAVMLSAQTTDKMVNKATVDLFKVVKTPKDVVKLDIDGFQAYVKTLNYYKTKSKNIVNASKILIEKFEGSVPSNINDLVSLPGVGRKTANVVLSVAFDVPTIAVDTHVARVSKRLGLTTNSNPDKIEQDLLTITEKSDFARRNIHHLFILHGRYVCKSQKPLCGECNIKNYCKFVTSGAL